DGSGNYNQTVIDTNLSGPFGVAVDSSGNVFIADSGHNRVVERQAPANTSPPAISGNPQEGQTLKTTRGSWSSSQTLTYSYQWQRCDTNGNNCTNIATATRPYYNLPHTATGRKFTVIVTATDQEHQTGHATPTPIGPVTS